MQKVEATALAGEQTARGSPRRRLILTRAFVRKARPFRPVMCRPSSPLQAGALLSKS